jgi:hypothetical protein
MSHRLSQIDNIKIATAFTMALKVFAFLEFRQNSLDSTFRNTDLNGHITHPDGRVVHEAHHDKRMIAQKCPAWLLGFFLNRSRRFNRFVVHRSPS